MMFAPCGDSSIRWTDAVNSIVGFGLIRPMYRLTENACITCVY